MIRWVGLLAAAVVAIAAGVVLVAVEGGEDRYLVDARIADAEGIEPDFVVRIDGVEVGTVRDVEVERDDVARLRLELEPAAAPIGRGARLSARAANLLGEKYLDLAPGDRSLPLPSGTTIPLARTRSEVQLDDIFNMLAPSTRARLRILINEVGLGLAGRGRDLNQVLAQMPGTLRDGQAVLDQLVDENRSLARLIDRAERTLTPSALRRRDVGRFVATAQSLLTTTAERRERLAETVRAAPGALRQLQASLGRIATSARSLRPAAALLRRSAPQLHRTLTRLPAFQRRAVRTLASARRAAPSLTELGHRGTPDVTRLTASLRRVAGFARAARPLTESVGRGRVFAGLLNVMQNWTRSINQSDALGHYFRLRLVIDPNIVRSLIQQLTPARQRTTERSRRPRRRTEPKRRERPGHAPGPVPAPSAQPATTSEPPEERPRSSKPVRSVLDLLLK